ncbi:hypothetical protein BJX70DRAFT_409027 [Aspergillus crustosus]
MVNLPSFTAALGAAAVGLLLSADRAVANFGFRNPASPSYSSFNNCPERCTVSGPNPGNWSVYSNLKQIARCKQTVFYDFSLYDPVDKEGVNHKIHACSSFGPDFALVPPTSNAKMAAAAKSVDVEFEMGWWEEGPGLRASGLRSLVNQLQDYLKNGHGTTDGPFILYGQTGAATIGVYIGEGLLNAGFAKSALTDFQANLENLNATTPSVAMQLCEKNYDSGHIFGVIATSHAAFAPVQKALKSWADAECLSFEGSTRFPGPAKFTTPLLPTNRTIIRNNSTALPKRTLHARAECETVQCGISGADFTKYNPAKDFCAKLQPKQHVCCSSGDMPDFRPQPNEDGTCKTHQVTDVDNCANLAAEYSLTNDDLEEFNKNTWGWNGCDLLFKDTVMCLSKGTAPFPAPIANAQCGPQKPGSKAPSDDSDISELNPCPLNACCNVWGQCGITRDFCVDTNTGAPGTAKPGTYGCISNCGTDVVKGDGTGAITIAYFEGYGLGRECLYQDALQIDTSGYTHIHFGFGTLTPEYDVEVGDALSTYQFNEFKRITGAKRILSFGGWAFSNDEPTYPIFRTGVRPENRLTMATKIAEFIKKHELDGVDIDWEYPGAPDLPVHDPGTPEEGPNYLAFLAILKNLLPGKSISIAAPSSYWYLKQFPIKDIGKLVDYIVYMTYDLHGQWDAHNSNSQEGCDTGNCLRSQVNLTETEQSLAMITKAGVPGNKVIVGVTSYGRSFKMADPACHGPDCLYTGDQLNSNALKGKCTSTAGYLADAEIEEILADPKRVNQHFVDPTSHSDILVYDNTEWVGYMGSDTKNTRSKMYRSWGLGGTTDWATDLQTYNKVPAPALSWASFRSMAMAGQDPKADHSRNGNWTDFGCDHEMIVDATSYLPEERWATLGADAAWQDVVRIWKDTDSNRPGIQFMQSVSTTLHMGAQAHCGQLTSDSCVTKDCPIGANDDTSGPAAQLIWNSLVEVHKLHADFHDTLFEVATLASFALDDFELTFAPVPPEESNMWLEILLTLLTLGTLSGIGPFFNTFLKAKPFFTKNTDALADAKDVTTQLIAQGITIAKILLPSEDSPWTAEAQDKFSHYMGQAVNGWANITSLALEELFDGSHESLKILGDVMSGGKLIEGRYEVEPPSTGNSKNELRANIYKTFYGYSIPQLWSASKHYPFIVDAGHACDEGHQIMMYIKEADMDTLGACVDGRQYYLAHIDGDSKVVACPWDDNGDGCEADYVNNWFSKPVGVDSLGGDNFGGITVQDLVAGSVRSWLANGKENRGISGPVVNTEDRTTVHALMDVDMTTAGVTQIPVCDPNRAWMSWDTSFEGSSENYPCDAPPGKNECEDSTFENETSGGSPLVEDCLQIVKNYENDATTGFTTPVAGKQHREIGHYGTCAFGVQALKVDGHATFQTGGQDIIDLIKDSVNKYAWQGKVGAKGTMRCKGTLAGKKQDVEWGIYHYS